MAKRTASDLADQIGSLAEALTEAAKMEVRQDLAAEITDMLRHSDPEMITGYLRGTPSYLPGVDADSFEITEDFIRGLRFAVSLLRDKDFDY